MVRAGRGGRSGRDASDSPHALGTPDSSDSPDAVRAPGPPAAGSAGPALAQLNGILWDERDLLEDLFFALGSEQWLAAGGYTRHLDRAAQRVRAANDRLRDAEVIRAAESDAVASGLGLPPAPSLTDLAESAGEPWRTILLEQRSVLLAAADEITRVGA